MASPAATDLSRSLAFALSALYSGLSATAGLSSSYRASQDGFSSSSARYRYALPTPGTVSRAGPCSWSYQSWNSASSTEPGSV